MIEETREAQRKRLADRIRSDRATFTKEALAEARRARASKDQGYFWPVDPPSDNARNIDDECVIGIYSSNIEKAGIDKVVRLILSLINLVKHNQFLVPKALVKIFLDDNDFAAKIKAEFNEVGWSLTPKIEPAAVVETAEASTSVAIGALTLENFTSEQIQVWRDVSAALSRTYRAQMTSEQKKNYNKEGAKRTAAYRDRMTPEQRIERSAKEAARLARKRALAKNLEP